LNCRKNQQLIFEEFTQADEKIEKKIWWNRLGRTISKMVAILGGELHLKSKLGTGSILKSNLNFLIGYLVMKHQSKSQKTYTAIIIDDDQSLLQLTMRVFAAATVSCFPF
jgi:hypothetical protein